MKIKTGFLCLFLCMIFISCKKQDQAITDLTGTPTTPLTAVIAGDSSGSGIVRPVNVWLQSDPMWNGNFSNVTHSIDANTDGIDDLRFIVSYNRALGGAYSYSCGATNIDSTLYAHYLVDAGVSVPVDSITSITRSFASVSSMSVQGPVNYSGYVNGAQNKYLIFSFVENNNTHFGWACVDIVHQQKMLIKRYCLVN